MAELKPLAVSFCEAARIAGFSEKTLRRAAADGRLTIVRQGRATRIRIADLEQWLGDAREGRLASWERRQAGVIGEREMNPPGPGQTNLATKGRSSNSRGG
jgi:excisionase family DNA binding protein